MPDTDYRLRLPINKIKQSLKDMHDFKISEGEIIVEELEEAKELFSQDYAEMLGIHLLRDTKEVSEQMYKDVKGIYLDSPLGFVKYPILPPHLENFPSACNIEKESRLLRESFIKSP